MAIAHRDKFIGQISEIVIHFLIFADIYTNFILILVHYFVLSCLYVSNLAFIYIYIYVYENY